MPWLKSFVVSSKIMRSYLMMEDTSHPSFSVLNWKLHDNPNYICPVIISHTCWSHVFCAEIYSTNGSDFRTVIIKILPDNFFDLFFGFDYFAFSFKIIWFRSIDFKESVNDLFCLRKIFVFWSREHFQESLVCSRRIISKLWVILKIRIEEFFLFFLPILRHWTQNFVDFLLSRIGCF